MKKSAEDSKFIYTLWNLMHLISQKLDEALVPYGVTHQQARALHLIYLLSHKKDLVMGKDLERAAGIRGSSVTSLIKGLEKRELISRKSGEDDGRTKRITLTPEGQKICLIYRQILAENESKLAQSFSPLEEKKFLTLLGKVKKQFSTVL